MFGFDRKNKKRKEQIIKSLEKVGVGNKPKVNIDLDDTFVEQSASAFAQMKKIKFGMIETTEYIATSFSPASIMIVEILEHAATVAIVARNASFLDVRYIRTYTYKELHDIYERLVKKEVEYDENWLQSVENIIVILTYNIAQKIPTDIVLIDNRNNEFLKIGFTLSKLGDKEDTDIILHKHIRDESGYEKDEIYESVIPVETQKKQKKQKKQKEQKAKKESVEKIFAVSLVEKEYFDKIDSYLDNSDFRLLRLYSVYAAMYAVLDLGNANAKLWIHIVEDTAMCLEKYADGNFETMEIDLSETYDSLLQVAYLPNETVLSGTGEHYERAKELLSNESPKEMEYAEHDVTLRVFSYEKDLPNCIVRAEKDISMHLGYAIVMGVAYRELFAKRFSPNVPGITKHLSVYNYINKNIKVLPFVMLIVVSVSVYALYVYLEKDLEAIKKGNVQTSKLVSQKKKLKKDIQRLEKNIRKTEERNKKIENIINARSVSPDAELLYEIAQKLPDDLIITEIKKGSVKIFKGKRRRKFSLKSVVEVRGKCYKEISLLRYIEALKIKNKKVFLISLKEKKAKKDPFDSGGSLYTQLMDTPAAKPEQKEKKYPQIAAVKGVHELDSPMSDTPMKDIAEQKRIKTHLSASAPKKKVYYSDTINNEFVLEIK